MDGGEKMLLFAHHHKVMDIYKREFKGYRPVFITGREGDAAKDAAAGCFGSVINMAHIGGLYSPAVASGVCEAEAEALLAAFFEKLRKKG